MKHGDGMIFGMWSKESEAGEDTQEGPNGEFALRSPLPQKWWIYADKRPALYNAIRGWIGCW